MSDVDIHHLAAAYALDALDPHERQAFEAHYPTCEVCRADVVDFRHTLGAMAEAAPLSPPPPVRQRVMAEIAHTRQLSPHVRGTVVDLAERRGRRRLAVSLMVAAAAVMAFFVGTLVTARDDGPAYADELAAVVAAPDGRVLTLGATGNAAGAVKVAWSTGRGRAVLLGDGLPPAPAGQAYELWLIDADGAAPMRVLDDAGDGEIEAVLDLDRSPQAWGVTLEPERGSPSPSGAVLYLAEA